MTAREAILNRLRRGAPTGEVDLPPVVDSHLFCDVPQNDRQLLVKQFAERLAALKGEFYAVSHEREAVTTLSSVVASAETGAVVLQAHPLLRRVFSEWRPQGRQCLWADEVSPAPANLAEAAVSVTVADALVARTGSIVLRSTTAGGRGLSVLPPVHVVVAEATQLVPSLEQALALLLVDGDPWSYATVITGPSRTADIEKILILGAHGPKRLAVILLPEAGLAEP